MCFSEPVYGATLQKWANCCKCHNLGMAMLKLFCHNILTLSLIEDDEI